MLPNNCSLKRVYKYSISDPIGFGKDLIALDPNLILDMWKWVWNGSSRDPNKLGPKPLQIRWRWGCSWREMVLQKASLSKTKVTVQEGEEGQYNGSWWWGYCYRGERGGVCLLLFFWFFHLLPFSLLLLLL